MGWATKYIMNIIIHLLVVCGKPSMNQPVGKGHLWVGSNPPGVDVMCLKCWCTSLSMTIWQGNWMNMMRHYWHYWNCAPLSDKTEKNIFLEKTCLSHQQLQRRSLWHQHSTPEQLHKNWRISKTHRSPPVPHGSPGGSRGSPGARIVPSLRCFDHLFPDFLWGKSTPRSSVLAVPTLRIFISLPGWWCNNHLEKYEFVNGKDYPQYIMENKIHVPNHQPATCFSPRVSERRVLPIVGVCISSSHLQHLLIFTPSHLHTFSSSHLLTFTSSHLHIFSLHIFESSHLLVFTSSHLHICSSSHLLIFTSSHFTSSHLHIFSLHIFSSSHLLIFTSSHLHIFSSSHLPIFNTFSSSHLLIFTSSHLHTFSPSHLLIFTSSHLHIFSSSHLLIFTSAHLHICTSSHLLIFAAAHLDIFSSSHLLIFTSSHLHIFSSSHLLIFTSSHPHIFTSSSHLHIFSCCPLALLKAGAGAVPTRRHETQPFRTKRGSIAKNWGKSAIPKSSRATLSHEMRFDRQKLR